METSVGAMKPQKPEPLEPQQLVARLDLLSAQLAFLVEKQRKQDEMLSELAPVLKQVMATATTRLDELEKKGYFAFGKEALGVAQRVVEAYSAEDVRLLGNAVVGIVDTLRALTQPEVLEIAGQASEVLMHADTAEPVGIFGMVRATRDDEVQRGMAVMLGLLKHVGRGARAISERKGGSSGTARPVLRLEANAGGTSGRALGIQRAPAAPAERRAPACAAAPSKPAVATTVIDGVEFAADGHMVDATAWTRALGENIARLHAVVLTEEHWKIVEFARAEFLETKASPNIRRITQGTGITTKALYTLFPRAPARTVAKIAGTPKPVGCL